ncbi:MAG: ComF family protein [Eubacterium sp.]|nr:ComF family protein [Eubacterium sp.]
MIGDIIKDAVFPLRCAMCDEVLPAGRRGICKACSGKVSYLMEPRCLKCGKEIEDEDEDLCMDCSGNTRSYDAGYPLFNYIPPVSDSLVRFKYHGREEYAEYYGKSIAERYKDNFFRLGIEAIVPVPLHKERLKKRGYDQAKLIASVISRETKIKMLDGFLERVKNTAPQKELNDVEREKNLMEAFCIGKGYKGIIPEAVLLVDDIYTTGATIEGCTRVLKAAGVKRVFYTSVAIGKV